MLAQLCRNRLHPEAWVWQPQPPTGSGQNSPFINIVVFLFILVVVVIVIFLVLFGHRGLDHLCLRAAHVLGAVELVHPAGQQHAVAVQGHPLSEAGLGARDQGQETAVCSETPTPTPSPLRRQQCARRPPPLAPFERRPHQITMLSLSHGHIYFLPRSCDATTLPIYKFCLTCNGKMSSGPKQRKPKGGKN